MSAAPYADNLEYLMDELHRLDLLLKRQVIRLRATRQRDAPAEFRGLVISDAEVDEWLEEQKKESPLPGSESQGFADLANALHAATTQISVRMDASLGQGMHLRVPHLAVVFGLNPLEVDAFLICLAPALDLRYQKLYAYLQDDVTKKRPTVNLVLSILYESVAEKLTGLTLFARDAPLRRHRLISLSPDPTEVDTPLMAQFLTVDERLVDFLLGRNRLDARWEPFAHWAQQDRSFDTLVFSDTLNRKLHDLCDTYRAALEQRSHNWVLFFQGNDGTGKVAAAEAFCHRTGLSLLIVDMPVLLQYDAKWVETFAILVREARLYGAAIYLDGWQVLTDDHELSARSALLFYELAQFPGLIFLGSTSTWQPLETLATKVFVRVTFPMPGLSERLQIWQSYASRLNGKDANQLNLPTLAATFRFTGGQIVDALRGAHHRALSRGENGNLPTMNDLYRSCRAVSAKRLDTFARHVVPKHTWNDLVLPGDSLAQLMELCGQVRYRLTVFEQWGFAQKLSLGKGLIALLSGPSGTGKTFSAEIIAGDLGMDLYQIDLSAVVSKYIGETEKNLSRVFQEAQESNAILFFDEADALFGKRTEVRDAHDRYANIEVNYLLQRIEDYEGAVILATNMHKNIDEAFLRRMHFVIEFPLPDENHRYRIWRGIFPSEAPLAEDVDLAFLARQFKLSGGNIKNIVLAAAFMAASQNCPISMRHIILALKRELQKANQVCTPEDFGVYYEWVY